KLLTVTSDDGTTTAQSFQVLFAADSGDVKKTVWEGHVEARLSDRRHGVGDRLVYDADTSIYLLTGNPAQALMPKDDTSIKCTIQSGSSLKLNRTSNAGEGGLFSTEMPCDTQLPTPVKEADLMSTLRTEGLTKSYGGRTVVQNVNLKVSSGEIV